MRTFLQDLKYGFRVLRGSPGFAFVAIFALALGIAVNTTVFSWIDAVLLRNLPCTTSGDRLVAIESVEPKLEGHNISYPDLRDYRDNLKLLSGIAVTDPPKPFSIGEGERAQRVWGELVTANYFDVLGVKPFLGRVFLPEEQGEEIGAHPVAVISHRLWKGRFGGDPAIVGKTVRVNRHELTIVGIAPPGFGGITRGLVFDMWVPLTMGPPLNIGNNYFNSRSARPFQAIARLRDGATVEAARAELVALARELAERYPNTNHGIGATLVPEVETHSGVQSYLRAPFKLLIALCVVVLLIACVNVANLLLARSAARQKELSIRLALGAGRSRIARQMLTESLLLAGFGAFAGIPLAMWMCPSLGYFTPKVIGLPVSVDVPVSGAALFYTILISAAAAILSGISPALHAIRADMNEALKEGGRSGASSAASHRMRSIFVVSEVALALVALVGAGLFTSSFRAALAMNPGFSASNVLISQFQLSSAGYDPLERDQFCFRLHERLLSAPGIVSVSYADLIPLGFGRGPAVGFQLEGYVPARGEIVGASRTLVSPGYFDTLRIPVLSGRDFTTLDNPDVEPSVIVNQAFAQRYLGGADPVGRKIRVWNKWTTIIGLVRDSKYYYLNEPVRPYVYGLMRNSYVPSQVTFYVRTTGDPAGALTALRREAAAIDPNAGAFDAMPLAEYIAGPLFAHKVAAGLVTALAIVSLILAAVGLYSVMAYAVSERTHEIGIRMALGAQPNTVLGMVIRKGVRLTAAGLLAGLVAALAAARLVASMLVGVSATDPAIFAAAATFLGAVAIVSSYLPARRATRVNPMNALRHQ
jgi:predicted permease